jgi:hypothetical protein
LHCTPLSWNARRLLELFFHATVLVHPLLDHTATA